MSVSEDRGRVERTPFTSGPKFRYQDLFVYLLDPGYMPNLAFEPPLRFREQILDLTSGVCPGSLPDTVRVTVVVGVDQMKTEPSRLGLAL